MTHQAFAYLRVSGRGQLDGDGFPRQLTAIQQYANSNDIGIVRVFEERAVSGTKDLEDRPALQALLEALSSQEVRLVLVEKLDRLARDLMIQETIISDLQKSGYELISTAEPDLCSDDPSRKLVRQIFGSIAEYERAMIVLKLRAARQRIKAKQGQCEGKKRFGFHPGEADCISRMKQLRAEGHSFDAVAAMLDAEGFKPRQSSTWNPLVISRILRSTPDCQPTFQGRPNELPKSCS